MSEEVEPGPLAPLVGEECDQIHFWADRVQVGFSWWDWWLTCTGSVTVHSGSARYRLPEPGARDAICSLINSSAEAASVDEEGRATIRFSNGGRIVVDAGGWSVERLRTKNETEP